MDVALVAGSVRWNGTLAVCWLPIKGEHKQKYVSHVDAMSTSPWNIPIYPGSDAYALAHIGTIQPYRTDPWRQGTSSSVASRLFRDQLVSGPEAGPGC